MPRERQLGKFTSHRRQTGMSLIELLIATAIVGLLATVAFPSYQDYVDRTDVALALADIDGIEQSILRFEVSAGRLPDDLTELGINNLLDPWGQPYEYLNHAGVNGNGKFRKFKGEVPLNSDYDLYSVGKDGRSNGPLTAAASKDDIVRAANGAFIGLGADYDSADFGDFGNGKK